MQYVQITLDDGTIVMLSDTSRVELMNTDSLTPERPVLWCTGYWLKDKLDGLISDV